MSDFRFANPDWIHAIWLVAALVVLLFWLDWRRGDILTRLLSSMMQSRLVRRLSPTRRWLSIAMFGMAGVSMVVALMRPQWGLTYQETPRVGAQIMVCLDVSKSMLAEDTAPNRLERAKVELTDLLSYLKGDQVGLIAFAGRAAVLCPLTPDFGFFRLILDGAGPDSVGRGGTRLEEPIRKALDGFRTESDVSRVILLITDGEDHDSHPLDAAKAAAERGVKILTIGFGDEAGSQIEYTDPESGARTVVRDSSGRPVVSRLGRGKRFARSPWKRRELISRLESERSISGRSTMPTSLHSYGVNKTHEATPHDARAFNGPCCPGWFCCWRRWPWAAGL